MWQYRVLQVVQGPSMQLVLLACRAAEAGRSVPHPCSHALADTRPWLSKSVLPCTGAGVVEEQEEDGEDEAMAEAEQVDQLREAGLVY